jgi:hypothetical protein
MNLELLREMSPFFKTLSSSSILKLHQMSSYYQSDRQLERFIAKNASAKN